MIFESRIPQAPLKNLIETFIYFEGYTPDHTLEKVIPDGYSYLIIELDGMERSVLDEDNKILQSVTKAWYSGVHTKYITIQAHKNSEMFVIQFKPFGAYPFIQHPMSEFVNKIMYTDTFWGEKVNTFRNQLLKEKNYNEKFKLAGLFCKKLLNENYFPSRSIIETSMQMQTTGEINTIAELIKNSGYSKKHFIDLFKKYIGITPKQLQRCYRFKEILHQIQENKNIQWSQIALQCGFFDQAHFIKEFKRFCGINPSKFIADYHDIDRTNFFPLD